MNNSMEGFRTPSLPSNLFYRSDGVNLPGIKSEPLLKRVLNNGIVLSRMDVPGGEVFFADAGPEGKVLVWDTRMIPPSVLLAALAWHFDREVKHPAPEFNITGFRC